MEEPYDAHGDSSSARYAMPAAYAKGFTGRAAELGLELRALAITTTPRFGSSTADLSGAGWVTMPQAFSGADPSATVAAVVDHMVAWGWPAALIRPLVQVYATDGRRPVAQPYLDESAAAGVGVVPYIVEQALDDEGRALLVALTSATMRPFPLPGPLLELGGGETMVGLGTVTSLRTAWDELEQSKADDTWRRNHPGEVDALKNYWDAPAGTPAPTTIKTHYGKGLLALAEARRYAKARTREGHTLYVTDAVNGAAERLQPSRQVPVPRLERGDSTAEQGGRRHGRRIGPPDRQPRQGGTNGQGHRRLEQPGPYRLGAHQGGRRQLRIDQG